MGKDLGQILNELKDDISAYVELKAEILKLNAFERAGKLVSSLSYVVIIAVLIFFSTLFLFLALGLQLGAWLHSISAGIAIVGGIYILAIGVLVANKKRFSTKVTNSVIRALENDEENSKKNEEADHRNSPDDSFGATPQ